MENTRQCMRYANNAFTVSSFFLASFSFLFEVHKGLHDIHFFCFDRFFVDFQTMSNVHLHLTICRAWYSVWLKVLLGHNKQKKRKRKHNSQLIFIVWLLWNGVCTAKRILLCATTNEMKKYSVFFTFYICIVLFG